METTEISYTVKTPVFEGPLGLLLSLIESRKLFVNEISLAQVTDDYISYIRGMVAPTLSDTTSFVVVAATLILIKSKSLLPNLELTGEETEKITDLEKRLKLYQAIKNSTVSLKSEFGKTILYMAPERSWNEPLFSPDVKITMESMLAGVKDALDRLPKKEFLPEVSIAKVVSIEEMIENLTARITTALNFSFKDLKQGKTFETPKEEKVFIIVSFLAMLELVRSGILEVIQQNTFDDMAISKQLANQE
jgi:segregation and condensation protein A